MRVVDTCAGAGGKTPHCCSFDGKQRTIAMDLYESKLKQLKIRAKRDGHRIALSTLQSKLHQKADRLIRCTMQWFGVLKETDAKWKLKPEFIDNMRKIQAEVESYSKIVKPGGKMVMLLARYYL
jgi:16S rRNA (cytosine967-C5)-methyltransferase